MALLLVIFVVSEYFNTAGMLGGHASHCHVTYLIGCILSNKFVLNVFNLIYAPFSLVIVNFTSLVKPAPLFAHDFKNKPRVVKLSANLKVKDNVLPLIIYGRNCFVYRLVIKALIKSSSIVYVVVCVNVLPAL